MLQDKFMKYVILIIVGIAGVVLGTYFGRRRPPATLSRSEGGQGKVEKESEAREDVKKKKENLEKARRIFAGQRRVANDDVEKLLGVSDATSTRYLDELEKEGLIRQVGKAGKHIYYEKTQRLTPFIRLSRW